MDWPLVTGLLDDWRTLGIPALCLAGGLTAGIINTLAGGGSLLTLPILILSGLPPQVANGTNRVPLVAQNVFAVAGFRKGRVREAAAGWRLAVPAVIGAAAGAWAASMLGEVAFRRILAGVLLLVLVPVFSSPERRLGGRAGEAPRVGPVSMLLFLGVGFYGGFVQAGVGFLILGVTVLACGYDLVRANAIKVFVVLVYTVAVLPVFALHGLVDVRAAIAMTIGQAAGGWIGSQLAIRRGVPLIRAVLVVMSGVAAAKLLFFP
jgi:uncharacterized membrane protein YfcA